MTANPSGDKVRIALSAAAHLAAAPDRSLRAWLVNRQTVPALRARGHNPTPGTDDHRDGRRQRTTTGQDTRDTPAPASTAWPVCPTSSSASRVVGQRTRGETGPGRFPVRGLTNRNLCERSRLGSGICGKTPLSASARKDCVGLNCG